jgi:quaternary ammonium compound-resistance protein SugE
VMLFNDPVSAPRVLCMTLIVLSAAGLKLIDG